MGWRVFGIGILAGWYIFLPDTAVMRIEPINAFSERAAKVALQELRAYYNALAAKALAHSNYLKELGEGVSKTESEGAKNEAMFAVFRRAAEAQNRALREYIDQNQR